MEDREIIERIRLAPAAAPRRGEDCLSESALAAYAESGVGDDGRAAIEAHLADCDLCLEQVALLVRLAEEPRPVAPAALFDRARDLLASEPPGERPWVRWGWAAAAALIVAVGAGLWTSTQRLIPVDPDVRTQRDIDLPAEPVPILLSPDSDAVVASGDEIRWREVPLALGYEVSVMTLDGTLLLDQRTEATTWRLPASDRLVVGESYYLWVRAWLADGASVRSPATRFVAGGQP